MRRFKRIKQTSDRLYKSTNKASEKNTLRERDTTSMVHVHMVQFSIFINKELSENPVIANNGEKDGQ